MAHAFPTQMAASDCPVSFDGIAAPYITGKDEKHNFAFRTSKGDFTGADECRLDNPALFAENIVTLLDAAETLITYMAVDMASAAGTMWAPSQRASHLEQQLVALHHVELLKEYFSVIHAVEPVNVHDTLAALNTARDLARAKIAEKMRARYEND